MKKWTGRNRMSDCFAVLGCGVRNLWFPNRSVSAKSRLDELLANGMAFDWDEEHCRARYNPAARSVRAHFAASENRLPGFPIQRSPRGRWVAVIWVANKRVSKFKGH